jgi:hypothetical protein
MLTKQAASKEVTEHMQRARLALDSAHRYSLNAEGVLRNPPLQASHLKIAREEINKALAIIEQRWRSAIES